MKNIQIILWTGVIVGVIIGAFILIVGMMAASGPRREAVVICLALACAILPYCLARAFSEMCNMGNKM
jgi:predicted permease